MKTSVAEKELNPVWDETFEWDLLPDSHRFELAIYSRSRWLFNDFLGSKKVVLPDVITGAGGTIIANEERLVTLILDHTSQGFVEVGITLLDWDYGPILRGESPELRSLSCVWQLHQKQRHYQHDPGPCSSHQAFLSDVSDDQAKYQRGMSNRRRWLRLLSSSIRSMHHSALHSSSLSSSLPPIQAVFVSPSSSWSSWSLHPSTSETTPSSYLQLLPAELITNIANYVKHCTPDNPFESWREDERLRFREATLRKIKPLEGGGRNILRRRRRHQEQQPQSFSSARKQQDAWRAVSINGPPVTVAGGEPSQTPTLVTSFRLWDGVSTANWTGSPAMDGGEQNRSQLRFLVPINMQHCAFREQGRRGLFLWRYSIGRDAPVSSDLVRSDRYTLCNLFSASEKPHHWEFFLVRKYPSIHPYGHVCTKDDLRYFIIRSLGKNRFGSVVERDRDMVIGGFRALGCTFVTAPAMRAPLVVGQKQTFNCVTNFFVSVLNSEGFVFQFQYITCWTQGNVTRALANHRKREESTFYWMLRSVSFSRV